MELEIKRQERENSHSLVRRFTKALQRSGLLLWAREGIFKQKDKSRNMRKREALRREKMKKEYEILRKLGKQIKIGKNTIIK